MRIPKVSIIIPTLNRANLIEETLESVKGQTFEDWECIVVDDGSSDSTESILMRFMECDTRFIFLKRPIGIKKGAPACRNIGLQQSKGKYIQFLDSDDLISPGKIEKQVQKMESESTFSLVTCKWGRFEKKIDDALIYNNLDSYSNFSDPEEFFNALPKSLNFFPIHAYLIKKEVIFKSGFWNEYIHFNDDAEFMVRVIANSNSIGFSEKANAYYRVATNNNVSSYSNIEKVQNGIDSWRLIEDFLKLRFTKENAYVHKGKTEFYRHIKVFPDLIERNKYFFQRQIKEEKRHSGLIKKFFK